MRLIVEKDKVVILSETPQDEAFMELVLGVDKNGDAVKGVYYQRLSSYKNGKGLVLTKKL
jgi:hypothetical protein